MARYIGPKCRRARRVGMPLDFKVRGEPTKCNMDTAPGGKGGGYRSRLTDYGIHQREVQRVKWYYGVLQRQFTRIYREEKRRSGNTGEALLIAMERRLDNVIFRLQMAGTRAQARQMIVHGHILVNGKKSRIPSLPVNPGDIIEPYKRERSKKLVETGFELSSTREECAWLSLDKDTWKGCVVRLPGKEDVPQNFDMLLVVEAMSR